MSPAAPPLAPTVPAVSEYSSLIERAAFTEGFDVQKLQALLDMREAEEMRRAEKAFNAALVRAQSEMTPVVADANNPQTKSRYATYAALDRAIRPHYTAHGLAPSFGTEPLTEPDKMRVVGILGHLEGFARRYQIDMPIDTKGSRGGDVMTRTHATGSALTYGKRYLLIAMFNLSIADSDDDDGNAAAGRRPYRPAAPQPGPRSMDEMVDRDSGEVIEHCVPFKIELPEGATWTTAIVNQLQRTLVASGLINSWFVVGSVSGLLTTLYGQILLAKLGLFGAMLALAAANRFWLVPRMIETRAGPSRDPSVWLGRLRYHVLGEQFLGLMVLLAVSVLGTMRPAVGQ